MKTGVIGLLVKFRYIEIETAVPVVLDDLHVLLQVDWSSNRTIRKWLPFSNGQAFSVRSDVLGLNLWWGHEMMVFDVLYTGMKKLFSATLRVLQWHLNWHQFVINTNYKYNDNRIFSKKVYVQTQKSLVQLFSIWASLRNLPVNVMITFISKQNNYNNKIRRKGKSNG